MQTQTGKIENKWPLISVITPTLNRGGLIENAIQSVLNQNYPHVEHIIVDGGSTDETLEILAKYSHLKVISEPDRGIADAMNKGIRESRGEIIGILNSDDTYAEEILGEVGRIFAENPDVDTVAGGALVYEESKSGQKKITLDFTNEEHVGLSYKAVTLDGGCINPRFFRRDVYRDVGLFNTQYRLAGDRDFLIRASMANLKEVKIPKLVYWYRSHPGSLTFGPNPSPEAQDEMLKILEHYARDMSVPQPLRQQARSSHSRRMTRTVALLLYQGKFAKAAGYIIRGLKTNPNWLFIIPVQLLQALGRRIQSLPQRLKHHEIVGDSEPPFKRLWRINRYRLAQELSLTPNRETKYGKRQEDTIKKYKKYLKGRILSVGCGDGYELELLKREGLEVKGIDVSRRNLRRAKKRGTEVILGFQEEIPFPDKSFDTILSSHTLEHSYNREKTAREMRRVARRAVVIVPIEPEADPKAVHASPFHSGEDLINLFKDKGTIVKAEPLQRLQQEYAIVVDFN